MGDMYIRMNCSEIMLLIYTSGTNMFSISISVNTNQCISVLVPFVLGRELEVFFLTQYSW